MKTCVICPRMGLGDLISFIAHFKVISKKTGEKLVIITKESTSGKEYLKNEPYCEDVIYLPERKRGLINTYSNIKDFISLVELIKKIKSDSVFVLHSSKRYVIASKIAGIKKICAPGLGIQNIFLSRKNSYYDGPFEKKIHPRLESENLIKKIYNLEKFPENSLINFKKNDVPSHVLISIACSGDSKQWGYENHKKIIEHLINKKFKQFVLLAGRRQSELESLLVNSFKDKEIILETTSQLKLKDVFNKIRNGLFYFGHDTGFMHLSASLNIPILAIYGDIPPYNYSKYMKSIVPNDNKFTKTSIKNILFEEAKVKLDEFLNEYNL